MEAGIYNKNNELVYNWENLIKDHVIDVYKDIFLANHKIITGMLVLSDDIKTIGKFSIKNDIEKLYISKNVNRIHKYMIDLAININHIEVDKDNPIYDSREDCNAIIETVTNKLLIGTKNTKIPSDIQIIGDSAFSCSKIEKIIIPEGVKELGQDAFESCNKLKKIILPKSLIKIEESPFNNSMNLKDVIYNGTEAEFKKINGWKHIFEENNLRIENFHFQKTLEDLIEEGYTLSEANRELRQQKAEIEKSIEL